MSKWRGDTIYKKNLQYGLLLSGFVLLIATYASIRVSALVEQNFNSEFNSRSQQIITLIERNLTDYQNTLESGKALYASSDNITRASWSSFIQSQNISEKYPEVRALEFIDYIPANKKDTFVSQVRAEGFVNFNIKPSTNNQDFFVVNYIEPLATNEAAFGFDLGSNSERRQALEQARDSNKFVITAPINLVQEENVSIAFLGLLPIFKNGSNFHNLQSRRQNLQGFVLAVFNLDKLFLGHTKGSSVDLGIDYHIFDSATEDLILESYLEEAEENHEDKEALFVGSIETGSREWELRATPNEIFTREFRGERALSRIILGLGVMTSVAIFIFFMLLDRSRRLAIHLAHKMTLNYKRSQTNVEKTLLKVQQERDKIDTILEEIGDGVLVIDEKKKIFLFNPSAEEITGFSKAEVINKSFTHFVKLIGLNTTSEGLALTKKIADKKAKKELKIQNTINRKNGIKIIIAITLTPLIDNRNKKIGSVVIFRDVSKEVSIDKVKTEFVSLAAHQLRSPITSLKLGLESILIGDVGKTNVKQTKLLSELSDISKRMGTLVAGFLTVSRLDLGTFQIQLKTIDLEKIARDNIKELKAEINTKGIKLKTEFKKIKKITSDENVINIILQNLLTNAVKYTPDKGTVVLSIKEKDDSVLIQVADSGYGIPKKDQKHIFTKLFRADNILDKHSGTGLGLYTVKSVVEQSGGKIWFESKENEGSIFHVTLPKKSKAKEFKK